MLIMFSIYYLGEFHNEGLENMGGEEELLIGQHVYVSITVKV